MDIIYSHEKFQNAEDVAEVFKRSGIQRPIDDLERIQRMIDRSDVLITAWVGKQMIGVARAITDFSYCCYLSDLAVDQAYQKRGIGKELIAGVRKSIGAECSLVLIAAPSAAEYYPHAGFEKSDRAFIIKRQR